MLNRVEVRTTIGTTLSLPLGDISSGYSVQGIDGLDPVPANIVSSSFARLDGEQYQSVRREKRNIVLRVGLEPDYVETSVRDLRSRLYGFLMPKSRVYLRFFIDDFPVVEIEAYVESFDCPLFTKDPVATISLVAMNPDFYEPVETVISGRTTDGTTMGEINYTGTVDTGILFIISLSYISSQTGFTIYNQPEGELLQAFQVSRNIQQSDRFEISTLAGDKYARLDRLGIRSSILSNVAPNAYWITLKPGRNFLRVQKGGAEESFTIRYTNKHGGL